MPITVPDSSMSSPAAFIDHTLLKPETSLAQINDLCEEAVEWGFAAV
ncbi:MAG: 2-deoxyribose-5-phosphate aldolase, partial [Desulfuromonas sp.]